METMTQDAMKAKVAATILGPTARLSDSEAIARLDTLRQHAVSVAPSEPKRGLAYEAFSRDWNRYVVREA